MFINIYMMGWQEGVQGAAFGARFLFSGQFAKWRNGCRQMM